MKRFDGKRVLVTGASGGIGASVVCRFREEGATVLGTDLRDADILGDLTNAEFADALPAKAAEVMGGLDVLCNNAGVIARGKITEMQDADYARSMGVNVEAPFRLCRAAIPIMDEGGGGAIVNTASCWGLRPGPDHPLYVMTKAAIASLTQCLGRDHAHQNIRVNAVCPNEVDTPMLRSGFEIRGLNAEDGIKKLNESVPLGRIADPKDIADVILFLASDDARYLCGALIEAHGGKAVQ